MAAHQGDPTFRSGSDREKETDKDTDATKGSKVKKTRTREGWEKKIKHTAKGHSK